MKVWEELVKKVIIVPMIIGALGCCTRYMGKNFADVGLSFGNSDIRKKLAFLEQQKYSEKYLIQPFGEKIK